MFPLSILLVVALLCVGSSLHLATQGAFKGLVRALSRREADVGATNTNGEPPLLLLDTGADPQTPSPSPSNAPSAAASADAGAGAHIRLWTWLRALPPRLRSQYRRTQEAAAKAEQLFTEVVSEIPELASPPLSSAESHALYVLYSGYVLVFLTLVVTVHLLSCWGMRLLAAAETVGLGGLGRLRGWAGMVNSSISPIPRIPLSPLPQPAVAAPSRRGGGDEGGLVGRLEAPELLSLYRQHTALVEQAPYLGARRSWCEREAALEMQCQRARKSGDAALLKRREVAYKLLSNKSERFPLNLLSVDDFDTFHTRFEHLLEVLSIREQQAQRRVDSERQRERERERDGDEGTYTDDGGTYTDDGGGVATADEVEAKELAALFDSLQALEGIL